MIAKQTKDSRREGITLEQITKQVQFEHNLLRQQLVKSFSTQEYEQTRIIGIKLIEASKKLNVKAKKNQLFDLIADFLLVAKIYLNMDDFSTARGILLESKQMLLQIIQEFTVSKGFKQSQSKQKEQDPNNDIDIKKTLVVIQLMASLFYSYGDNRTSELLYGEYVKIIENTSGAESFATGTAYFIMGVFYLQHKLLLQALACFRRTLNIRLSKFEQKDEVVADCFYNIGIVYKQMGKQNKAFQMLNQALELRRQLIGNNSLQVAMCLESIGKIFIQQGDYKSALSKFSECYNIRRRLINKDDHQDLSRISYYIFNLYQQVKQLIDQNQQGQKVQNILQNVMNKVEQTIIDNNMQQYINDVNQQPLQ